ncbi:hypothetical protein Tco_0725331 [Tanacetum coccineum]|uniref:Ty3 transposon capsid-like protein domain-containing protein n=1 Tax=Tanacetum coccineum TaxID=301880 RepID=A0ABQ4YCL5_9ASTR
MEDEFYNLTVKGNDLKTYVRRFQELAVLCPNMVPNTEKLMEVFIRGLPRSIEGNVTASKPQTLEEAITITQRLMDQTTEEKVDSSKALDASLVIIEKQWDIITKADTSSRSRMDAHDNNILSNLNPIMKERSITLESENPPVPQCSKEVRSLAEYASSSWEMMSLITTSDLAPQRQEILLKCRSGLVPQGQKAQTMTTLTPAPKTKMPVPTAEKTDSSNKGWNFPSVLLL